ncbi:MAG: keto-hydroxyglutarate-aldolase/keto-deoxy-phosphogluconate aldolase, partial [Akkermansiaceae bacterium]|nr:keto-hydroxyglutarate-aldolase/keto-deoxy-phosphogluconate aldolase [Akkermansiaceae bacterium]
AEYLASLDVLAVGGSWLAPVSLVAAEDWDEIEAEAQATASAVAATRGD